jgi:hypothetical protein
METAQRKLNVPENFVNPLGIDFSARVKRGTWGTSVLGSAGVSPANSGFGPNWPAGRRRSQDGS